MSSKAAPVTEVARESVASSNAIYSSSSVSLVEPTKQLHDPSHQLIRKGGSSSRSLPADATTTRINVASDGSESASVAADSATTEAPPNNIDNNVKGGSTTDGISKEDQAGPADTEQVTSGDVSAPGWFSWIYDYLPSAAGKSDPSGPSEETGAGASVGEVPVNKSQQDSSSSLLPQTNGKGNENTEHHPLPQKRSWFQMWNGGRSSPSQGANERQKEDPPNNTVGEPTQSEPTQNTDAERQSVPTNGNPVETDTATKSVVKNGKQSGWSFWSKGQPQETEIFEASVKPQGPPNLDRDAPETSPSVEVSRKGNIKPKNQRDIAELPADVTAVSQGIQPAAPKTSGVSATKQLQKVLPNQVLPRFKDTFALQTAPSFIQSIGRFLHYSKEPERKHVYVVRDPPHIKRALAIGVHGYFPAPFIRNILGQPTGTSVKFANMAANAITKWVDTRGYECGVEKIALEGEGRVAERVDLLWKLLLNWMDAIRKADFILFACHSQGVPVTVMLIAKLIAFGCLDATRVGVCAMAGVSLGPFTDYKSRWIGGSAGELFDFALGYSQVSKDYEDSLRRALDFGVRISYVGSIDDQLVSLEVIICFPTHCNYFCMADLVDSFYIVIFVCSHIPSLRLQGRFR